MHVTRAVKIMESDFLTALHVTYCKSLHKAMTVDDHAPNNDRLTAFDPGQPG